MWFADLVIWLAAFVLSLHASLNVFYASYYLKWKNKEDNINNNLKKRYEVLILIPCFNDKCITKSLSSYLHLEYENYKVVIADDSTDKGLKALLDDFQKKHSDVIHVVRRNNRAGFKAGALNKTFHFASKKYGKFDYVAIFDCDFKIPSDWLTKALSVMEDKKCDILQGYQKHTFGASSNIGRLSKLGQAGGIISMKGKEVLNLFPFFYGSCALIKASLFTEVLFNENSITEDFEFTAKAYEKVGKKLKVVVNPFLYAEGANPKNYASFISQQVRWASGTINDFTKHFFKFLKSKNYITTKIGFIIQGNYYVQGPCVLILFLSSIGALLTTFNASGNAKFPASILVLFSMLFWFLGYALLFICGGQLEKASKMDVIRCLGFGFIFTYIMCFVFTYSTLKGLLKIGNWIVTRKSML